MALFSNPCGLDVENNVLSILILFAILAFLLGLSPLGVTESGLNDYQIPGTGQWDEPAPNYGTADIPDGTVVCRHAAVTDTTDASGTLQALKKGAGIIAPTASANCLEFLGIARSKGSSGFIKAGRSGLLTRGGMVQARVRVPASTTLPIGTSLHAATTWDATNHKTLFATSTAGANPGVLEPLVYDSVIYEYFNPIAILKQAYADTSGSDSIQTLWVYVLPFHQPRPFMLNYISPTVIVADVLNILMSPTFGPGILDSLFAQMLIQGSAGSLAINAGFAALASTPDQRNLLSTAMSIVNDGTDGAVAGINADGAGDTDNGGLGTAGTKGVINATVTDRIFPNRGVINLSLDYTSGTADAGVTVLIRGRYF